MWCSAFTWDVESWKNHYSHHHDERKQDQLQNHNLCWSIRDLRLQSNQLSWNPKMERELQGKVPAAAHLWRSMWGEEAKTLWRGKKNSATALRNYKRLDMGLLESVASADIKGVGTHFQALFHSLPANAYKNGQGLGRRLEITSSVVQAWREGEGAGAEKTRSSPWS